MKLNIPIECEIKGAGAINGSVWGFSVVGEVDLALFKFRLTFLRAEGFSDRTFIRDTANFWNGIEKITYTNDEGEVFPVLENRELLREILDSEIFQKESYIREVNLADKTLSNILLSLVKSGNLDMLPLFEEKLRFTIDKQKYAPTIVKYYPEALTELYSKGWPIDPIDILAVTHDVASLLSYHPVISEEYNRALNPAIYLVRNFLSIEQSTSEMVLGLLKSNPNLLFEPDERGETLARCLGNQPKDSAYAIMEYIKLQYLLSIYCLNIEQLCKFLQDPDYNLSIPNTEIIKCMGEVAMARPIQKTGVKPVMNLIIARGEFGLMHEFLKINAISPELLLEHAIVVANIISYGDHADKESIGFKDFKTTYANIITTLKLALLGTSSEDGATDSLVEFCLANLRHEDMVKDILQVLFVADSSIFARDFKEAGTLFHILAANNKIHIMTQLLKDHYTNITHSEDNAQHAVLKFCADNGYLPLMHHLIREEAYNPNCVDKAGDTILSTLISGQANLPNILEITALLLSDGADSILRGDQMYHSPFIIAANEGRVDLLERLLESSKRFKGADMNIVVREAIKQMQAYAMLPGNEHKYNIALDFLRIHFPFIETMKSDSEDHVGGKIFAYDVAGLDAIDQDNIVLDFLVKNSPRFAPALMMNEHDVTQLAGDRDSKEEDY